MTKKQQLLGIAWGTTVMAVTLALIAWGQSVSWSSFNNYMLFPLFGLVAFGMMWSHYVASVSRQVMGIDKSELSRYVEITSWIVLAAIALHPGLLVFQLFQDGAGLPPTSYIEYVAPSLRWAVALGSVSLILFLAYELRRVYDKKPWWKYISYGTDLAMILIFIHGLNLGSRLQAGWFVYVWYMYGFTLLACLAYMHVPGIRKMISSRIK